MASSLFLLFIKLVVEPECLTYLHGVLSARAEISSGGVKRDIHDDDAVEEYVGEEGFHVCVCGGGHVFGGGHVI